MKILKYLILSLVVLFQLQCSHLELTPARQPNNESTPACNEPLESLVKKAKISRTAKKKGASNKPQEAILPPAEVKTLEAKAPETFQEFSQKPSIRISTYNVLNLKEMVGRYEPDLTTGKRVKTQPEKAKSQHAIDGVADAIKEISPDLIFLQEVEGVESLGVFASNELNNQWRPLIIKGNDSRGIHIGVLIKDSIPLNFEYRSHRDEPLSIESHPSLNKVFSRDFPVLIAKTPNEDKPLFIMAGVHGKSKRTENSQDPESREIRTAQAERMVEVIKFYQESYPNVPIIILGDFNAEVNSEPEYQALRDFHLKDAFDLDPHPLPKGDPGRITHTFHPKEGSRKASQLDAILLTPEFEDLVLSAKVYRYKNPDGTPKAIPTTYEEREKNPSDHYPVWAELNLQKMIHRN